jgi:predicted methyltransferase
LLATLAGCAAGSGTGTHARPAAADHSAAERASAQRAAAERAMAAALDDTLTGAQRTEANRARDRYRHPKETLQFFGLRQDSHVAEVWPADGWYTEIIAPLVNAHGKYYAAQFAPDPGSPYVSRLLQGFHDKLGARPDLYGGVEITSFGQDGGEIAPPGSVDLIVSFRNLHNWMAQGWAPQAFALMYRALKPGGVLGIVEHRGKPGAAQDPKAKSGYVDQDYAIRLIEAQGFRLEAASEVNANPKDTKDYEQGVWTLPPVYRLGDKDRERYAAIGESDRFTLRFVKPR